MKIVEVLPDGWRSISLDEATEVILSNVDKKSNENEKPVRLCNYTDVYYNDYIDELIEFMAATANSREIYSFRLKRNDVLITKDSETPDDIAVPALVANDFEDVLCGYHLAILRPRESEISGEFLHKLLGEHRVRHYFFTLANGATRFGLTLDSIKNAVIPLPPLKEQKKIATILSTWDRAIERTRELIEAKTKLKKALMQQLLTGKRRFKEFGKPAKDGAFPSDWRQLKLGEMADVLFSTVDKKTYASQSNVLLCNYMDVYNNDYLTQDLPFMEATASKTEIAKFGLQKGDVIVTKDSETPDDIAKASTVIEDMPGVVCGYHLAILRPQKNVDGMFLGRLLMFPRIRYEFTRLANGATRYGLPLSSIVKVPLWMPPKKEQERIAKVFLELDKEILYLKGVIERQRHLKQGLMQNLLNGKIRVKVK